MRWPIIRALLALSAIAAGAMAVLDDSPETPLVDAMAPVETEGTTDPLQILEPPEREAPVDVALAPPLFETALPLDPGPVPQGLPNMSAQGCNACHTEIHTQWSASPHARGWSEERFGKAMERVGESTACRSCHLPLETQHANLAKGYHEGDPARPEMVPNEAWDATMMIEGVGCAACHIRDGKVLSTRAILDAPHPMAQSLELGSSTLCATCHQLSWEGADQPIYDTFGEWSRSAYADAGVRCQDCHMPAMAGLATASRFAAMASHGLESDPSRALSLLVELDREVVERGEPWPVRIRVQNTGAGHAVPTGSPFKQLRLVATLLDAKGKELASPIEREFGRQIADAPPWETLSDGRILPGEEVLIQGEMTVSQRKRSGPIVLQIKLEKRIGDEIVESTELQRIPLSLW